MAAGLILDIALKGWPGQPPLFRDLQLSVAPGQVLALIGPSGVGKSTLLRMLAGLDRDYDGRVTLAGHPAGTGPVPGFVFQDPRLLPWATAAGNLTAVVPGLTRAAAVACLAEVGLAGVADALPHALSGGMQRRVALARALAANPALLLLDEPFVSVDRALARELSALVAALIDRHGSTAVLVTHEPEDAARLADRVVRLAGRPAQVTQDLTLSTPRAARDEAAVRDTARALAEGP